MVNKRVIPRAVLPPIALLLALAMLIPGAEGGVASFIVDNERCNHAHADRAGNARLYRGTVPIQSTGRPDRWKNCHVRLPGCASGPPRPQEPIDPPRGRHIPQPRDENRERSGDLSSRSWRERTRVTEYDIRRLYGACVCRQTRFIVFDRRGAGLSEPALDCPAVVDLNRDLLDMSVKGKKVGDKEALDLQLQAIAACAKTLGAKTDLSDFHTNASAADVEDLRRALGYNKVNLWGVLDGTRLALEVLRDYPAGVRSVVLDSVIPPEVDTVKESPANLARSLDVLFKACAADKTCNAAYPKLQQTFKDVVANLNKTPLSIKTSDPVTGKTYDARLDGNTMVGLLHASLGVTDLLPVLPMLIDRTGKGDATLANVVLGAVVATQSFVSDGDIYSSLCHDEVAFASPVDVNAAAKKYPELAGYFEYSLTGKPAFRLCETWGAGKGDPADNKPVLSDVPALVLRGSFDPNTAPAWGQTTAKNLKKGTFFEVPGLSSYVSTQPCPAQMMAAFLKAPSTAPDAACIKKIGQPQWKIPDQIKLVPYRDPIMGITGVVPEGWKEGPTGVFSRSKTETDVTALVLMVAPTTVKDVTSAVADNLRRPVFRRAPALTSRSTVNWMLYSLEMPTVC